MGNLIVKHARKETPVVFKTETEIPIIIIKTLQKRKENETYVLKIYNIWRI